MRSLERMALVTWIAAFACAARFGPAAAGVTIETRMDVTMLGGGGQGKGTVEIQGDARHEVRSIALAMPGMDAGGPQRSDAITRLDKGVQWQLDADDSSYRAVPLAQLGEAMAGAGGGGMGIPGIPPAAAASVSWAVVVTPRDESALIAGCRARRTDITLTGTSHDPDAGDAATIRLVTQWWMATGVAGATEQLAFERGFERATHGIGADVPGMLAGLPGAADAVARLTAARNGLAGVPMRTVLRLEAPGLAAMLGRALAGQGGGEGGGEAPDATPPSGDDDAQALVTSTIEVTSVRVGRIAASRFTPPAGYREAKADEPERTPAEVHE